MIFFNLLWIITSSFADLSAKKILTAELIKQDKYISDGLFIGGDHFIDGVIIKNIRRSINPQFDRMVIDLECSHQGELSNLQRPPYYQVAISAIKKELIFSLWGNPQLQFHAPTVLQSFYKSKLISQLLFFPTHLEPSLWMLSLTWNRPAWVEVFELSNPVRIIIDLKPIPKPIS